VGKQQPDMIRGTLDMMILKVLSLQPLHGWGICERIRLISEDELQVNQGSLYPALHKLRKGGSSPIGTSRRTTGRPAITGSLGQAKAN